MTFEGKAKLFSSETSYIEFIALYVHPKKIANILNPIQVYSRLGLENKFLENKSGPIFCIWQNYFTNCYQQIWGCLINQPLIIIIHHIWGETVLFIIQTSDRMQYFTILQDKLHSVNIQDNQSWALSETIKKISKITHTASRFSFL